MRSAACFALAALALSCTSTPCASGSDASVRGTWTVEGAAPTAASCDEVGIDTVRLGVYCGANVSYLERVQAPCTAGSLDSVTAVLAAGSYDVAWEGFRAGVRVAQGERHHLVVTTGVPAVVPVVDFVSGYDPSGSAASVSARWTVDGVAPTTATCMALGVTRVRIAVFHRTRAIELAPLTATCGTGAIDTRPIAVLAAGDIVLQLQALDAHQGVVFSGAMAMLHVPTGPAHVALYDDVPVDFASTTFDPHGSDATVGFGWTLDHQTPSIDVCDAVGVSTASLVLYAHDDAAHAHGVSVAQAPCHLGAFDSGTSTLVRAGAYLASIEARDATGAAVASASPSATPFAVTAGTRFDVPAVDLVFPTTLTVTLDWGDRTTGSASTCAGAGVSTMSYALTERPSGTVVAQASGVPCVQRLSFDAMRTSGFGAGTYDLALSGTGPSGTWHSSATECTGIDVGDGAIAWDACLVATP